MPAGHLSRSDRDSELGREYDALLPENVEDGRGMYLKLKVASEE